MRFPYRNITLASLPFQKKQIAAFAILCMQVPFSEVVLPAARSSVREVLILYFCETASKASGPQSIEKAGRAGVEIEAV